MPRSTDAQQLRRSKLQCCRPARVEQFTAAPATRHELCAFQASTENISIINHGALWPFAVLHLRNTLTYLLTKVEWYGLLSKSSGLFRGHVPPFHRILWNRSSSFCAMLTKECRWKQPIFGGGKKQRYFILQKRMKWKALRAVMLILSSSLSLRTP